MARGIFRSAGYLICAALPVTLLVSSADAALVISTDATSNVTCSGGVCSATAADAALNVNDLTTMLASAPLTIQSGSLAQDIQVEAPFSWTSSSALALDSYHAITVDQPVSDAGPAALTITTSDGGTSGTLFFGTKGRIQFTTTKNTVVVNGQHYKLVKDIASLAAAVANNPSGFYALKDNYNAVKDGIYGASPISTTFTGSFEGLGNSISNVALNFPKGGRDIAYLGMFSRIGSTGAVSSLRVMDIAYDTASVKSSIGGLVGYNQGSLVDVDISGSITANGRVHKYPQFVDAGGIAGANTGAIASCFAKVEITAKFGTVGGLVSENSGPIELCHVEGAIRGSVAGGVIGDNYGAVAQVYSAASVRGEYTGGGITGAEANNGYFFGDISNSYSTGSVSGGDIGGFIVGQAGPGAGSVESSYSTGKVTSPIGAGGFACGEPTITNSYWDTKTSHTKFGGCEYANLPGVTGLTDAELKSGLPAGFDPNVWAEDPNINNGYPYLIANPPVK